MEYDLGPPIVFGRRHASHTRAHSRCQHGFPSAPQRVPGCQHVALPLLAVVMQRWSRHRRLTTRQTRASERCCRPPRAPPKSAVREDRCGRCHRGLPWSSQLATGYQKLPYA